MSEWISVGERLPEESVDVLFVHMSPSWGYKPHVSAGRFSDGEFRTSKHYAPYRLVTHWQPLPDPPPWPPKQKDAK